MIAQYFEEREKLTTIQTDKYFFMYRFDPVSEGKVLFIHTFYIPPQFRDSSAFKEMMSEIEKILDGSDAKKIICSVQIDDVNHPKILPLILKAGFEIYLLKDKSIWLRSTNKLRRGY